MAKRTRRQKAIIRRRIFFTVVAAILIGLIALIGFIISSIFGTQDNKPQNNSSITESVASVEEKETFATVLSTGDIMVHDTQVYGAYNSQTGEYDFSAFFKETASYFKSADLSVANLEVTFGGTESGKYSGYPAFNTPDSLADAIKNSGLNFLITANNHSYDTGLFGLKRTAQILKQKGIEFIGTRETTDDNTYAIKAINGIKIGMANYTYSTFANGKKALNGNVLKEEAGPLVNTFDYNNIESFYTEAQSVISEMKHNGAEFIVFYMHWGNEYQLKANTWQKSIAQKLSNLGVDIIIGSHPHVIEPIELIHSEDGQNTTVCVYSTGNVVSNQRQEIMDSCPSGHTEDGMLFSFTLRKYKNEVSLDSVDLIPTWVNRYKGGGGYLYTIYPLENADWGSTKYSLDATAANKALKSYERTKAIVAEGLTEVQKHIGCEITFK
ncbi:MAG: CapA family protein [Clostridia bacterium]|nr:CapA family protein [Clostridia bacterium]